MLWSTDQVLLGPLPVAPPPLTPAALPVLPLLAPAVLAVVLAIVFQSPLALLLGALGPLMVWGGWWESRRQGAKAHEVAELEYENQSISYRQRVDDTRHRTLESAWREHPSLSRWSADPLWRGPRGELTTVSIGARRWEPPSSHELAGTGMLSGMPALVDLTVGLAFVAPTNSVDLWRALALQWRAHSAHGVLPPWESLEDPPRDFRGTSRIVWVEALSAVPDDCRTTVILRRHQMAEIHAPGQAPLDVQLESCSHAQAARVPEGRARVPIRGRELVDVTRSDQLWMGLSPEGSLVDVVAQGPHTIVWGATGSGKSVTVVSMVNSLAQNYPPRALTLVLIDFKGGAGLAPLRPLAHTIGWVSDLAVGGSERALRGLRAEMTRRERILAAHGCVEWSELDQALGYPRLVVVIDELAWLLTNHPQWAEAITDTLARGRSLGVHLILSTQRLSGVVTRAMMANISLRLCGRVSDESEVTQWMPDISPALVSSLRHLPPGHVVLAGALAQPAIHAVTPGEVTVDEHESSSWRVWGEPLPPIIPWQPGHWAWQECWDTHSWISVSSPLGQGPFAIVGDHSSGRTSAAHALAQDGESPLLAPADAASVWAALTDPSGTTRLLVIDDIDVLLQSAGPEGEACVMDALEGFSGSLIMTMGPHHRLSRSLARLATQVLVLGIAKPEDQDVWGRSPRLVPGAGLWRGEDIQVVHDVTPPALWEPEEPELSEEPLVLTQRPEFWEAFSSDRIIDPTDHGAAWSALEATRGTRPVLFDGLSHRDVRALGSGVLWIPPLVPPEGLLWLWNGVRPVLTSRERWLGSHSP